MAVLMCNAPRRREGGWGRDYGRRAWSHRQGPISLCRGKSCSDALPYSQGVPSSAPRVRYGCTV